RRGDTALHRPAIPAPRLNDDLAAGRLGALDCAVAGAAVDDDHFCHSLRQDRGNHIRNSILLVETRHNHGHGAELWKRARRWMMAYHVTGSSAGRNWRTLAAACPKAVRDGTPDKLARSKYRAGSAGWRRRACSDHSHGARRARYSRAAPGHSR